MVDTCSRMHTRIEGSTRAELGRNRGEQLRGTLGDAYEWYSRIFRASGISHIQERRGAHASLAAIESWRPEVIAEFQGIAEASGLDLLDVAALNSRTEILGLGTRPSMECSTVAAEIGTGLLAVQTWDWHVELDRYWHTHEVTGVGYRFVGLTEQGIIGKIGVNEAGLALHFNILAHQNDQPGGIPMHVLSNVVLTESGSVEEAIELIEEAKITSSSSFTLLDENRAVSLEITPVGVFQVPQQDGYVIRTNHFQDATPAENQKTSYEPDSTDRFDLLRSRLQGELPHNEEELVQLLESSEGEAPLSCVADTSKPFGERWQTLSTCVTNPRERKIDILDGMPTERTEKEWLTLRA